MTVTIYHNPRCSKSRATLELLRARGIEPHIIEYLKTPPDAADLQALIEKLDQPPMALVRASGDDFASSGLDPAETDPQRITQALQAYPALLQRPLVVAGDRARIGRPPENVLELL